MVTAVFFGDKQPNLTYFIHFVKSALHIKTYLIAL